jgi:peptidoglycan L-alanyl-D-glutamate endopeptidase CwlK
VDAISETRLNLVHPTLAAKIRLLNAMLGPGTPLRVTQGLRTWEEQAALYAQGRTMPGRIVTDAQPGYSQHNFGLAVDVVPMTDIGPDWDIDHPIWQRIVTIGTGLGLVAGAQWRTFPDWPHFQLTGALPVTPDDNMRALFKTSGLLAVWTATGLDTGDNIVSA